MIRPVLHIVLHFLVPALVARFGLKEERLKAWMIMVSTMIIDLDHLLADPIYDPGRCSVGFHPLHTTWPIVGYIILTLFPKTRLFGLGLLIHIALDWIDCQML